MSMTNNTCNAGDTTCDYCTVSKWAKGDHRAIIPEKWSDLISGEVCDCCMGKNIRPSDLEVLKSMAGLLSDYLEEHVLRRLSFYEACQQFIVIVDDLEIDQEKGEGTAAAA